MTGDYINPLQGMGGSVQQVGIGVGYIGGLVYPKWQDQYPYNQQHFHHYHSLIMGGRNVNKVETSFKIVKKLIDLKIIEKIDVVDFVRLVDELSKELE